ncbi:MAG: MarR family winged helix-turn-helix transcriptional regulator [Acidobacteriaceae bacterium]
MSAAKPHFRSVNRPEDHLGYWLTFVSSKVVTSLARRLEAHGVSVSEWVALRKLYDQPVPISISALADSMGMTKAPVSRLVERLVQKELVERQDSRDDGRAQQIWLNSMGRKLVPKLAAIADENDEAFFGDLRANARVALMGLMRKIAEESRRTQIPSE